MQSYILCCSFYSWLYDQSTGTGHELCTLLVSHPANIYGKHTNIVLTHSPYCFFLCVFVNASVYLCGLDKYHSFRLEERLWCVILALTHIVAHSIGLTHTIDSIRPKIMIRRRLTQLLLLCRFDLEIFFFSPASHRYLLLLLSSFLLHSSCPI